MSDLVWRELHAAFDDNRPALLVIAGSNGAGKSTFFEEYLEAIGLPFVNADRLTREKWPDADPATVAYQAAELAETERRNLLSQGVSFCMEIVFSDPERQKLDLLKEAQLKGYTVILVFIARVWQRVNEGGHDVPDEKLNARFPRTLKNLQAALIFDNSFAD